ncbi:hypothetical protein AB1K70_12015 [Bremerella sp. JC770]|uniref:hypothetical protein n=1 Tax=Bremerella sp. JC770 TaxID=3232137 RepID=UPI003458639E
MITREFDLEPGESIVFETEDEFYRLAVIDIDEESEEILVEITSNRDLEVRLGDRTHLAWGMPECFGYPRFWVWFSLILSHRIRHDVFTPTYNEFVEDYLLSKKQAKHKWEKRWTTLVFQVRTLVMIFTCLKMQVGGTLGYYVRCMIAMLWLNSWRD